MSTPRVAFWIDVGGTFTDCFARWPDGRLSRHKLLSSGITKGSAAPGSTSTCLVDPLRKGDPVHFWQGYRLRLLDSTGQTLATTTVDHFDAATGTLQLFNPLPISPGEQHTYELSCSAGAPIVAIRYLLGLQLDQSIPAVDVRLGTTRGTNALLTRQGARTAFVTTQGFGDILHIGYQDRPRLFDLNIQKPEPLFCQVVEIDERVTSSGEVLRHPQPERIRTQLAALRELTIESLAICLLHAYEHPAHEQLVGQIAAELGLRRLASAATWHRSSNSPAAIRPSWTLISTPCCAATCTSYKANWEPAASAS